MAFLFFIILRLWGIDLSFGRLFTRTALSIVVALLLGVSDMRIWRVLDHYVAQARAQEDFSTATAIGIDETALFHTRVELRLEGSALEITGRSPALHGLSGLEAGPEGRRLLVLSDRDGLARLRALRDELQRYDVPSLEDKLAAAGLTEVLGGTAVLPDAESAGAR